MAKLNDIVEALNMELRNLELPDYGGAMNGLQLETDAEVSKVALAVDATLPVVRKAVDCRAQLLVVHHGLFWQGAEQITGPFFKKMQLAMANGLGVFSSHIPLDVHPELGNNAVLCQKLADVEWQPFFDWKGIQLGLSANLSISVGELAGHLEKAVGRPLLLGPRNPNAPAGKVGVITGGAGSEVKAAHAAGIQTFVSGEAPHWAHGLAEELDIELLLGGHYATETFGVKALGEWLEDHFAVEVEFLDHPSNL